MKNTKYSKENSKPLHLHKPKEIMSTVLCATLTRLHSLLLSFIYSSAIIPRTRHSFNPTAYLFVIPAVRSLHPETVR